MSFAGFEKCLAVTELPENDGQALHVTRGDPGGATDHGLTFHIFAAWRLARGKPEPTLADFAACIPYERDQIFHAWYWMAVAGDRMPLGLDLIMFEIAFLAGPERAAKALQAALGEPVTGRLDGHTVATAAATSGVAELIARVADAFEAQAEHFGDAAEFERGWFRRIHCDVVTALAWRVEAARG